MLKTRLSKILLGMVFVVSTLFINVVQSATLSDYLIVGRYVNDTAVDTSNYELGSISSLSGAGPSVSSPGVGPSTGVTNDARIAILNSTGTVKMSDVDVLGTGATGIDCAGSYNNCTDNGSNLSNTDYNGSAMGSSNGVAGNVDLSGVSSDISDAQTWLNGLSLTGSIATSGGDINSDVVVNLVSGLNVLDFSGAGGSDITVAADLIFQGGADAFAVVLVNDGANFKTSNGNLVIGNGGIGLNNVVIVSGNDGTDGSIDLSNSFINGVALWDLGPTLENNLSLDNVTGCTQLVGDDVDIQNVRLSKCAFTGGEVPVPGAIWLFGSALGLLGWMRRKAS